VRATVRTSDDESGPSVAVCCSRSRAAVRPHGPANGFAFTQRFAGRATSQSTSLRSGRRARPREVWVTGHSSGRGPRSPRRCETKRAGCSASVSASPPDRRVARAREREPAPALVVEGRGGRSAPRLGRDRPASGLATCSRPGFTSRSFGVSRTRSSLPSRAERLVAPAHPRSRRGGPRRARPAAGTARSPSRVPAARSVMMARSWCEPRRRTRGPTPARALASPPTAIGLACRGPPLDRLLPTLVRLGAALIVATDAWRGWCPAHPEADRRSGFGGRLCSPRRSRRRRCSARLR